jgi:hypothetical protein
VPWIREEFVACGGNTAKVQDSKLKQKIKKAPMTMKEHLSVGRLWVAHKLSSQSHHKVHGELDWSVDKMELEKTPAW